MGMTWVVVRRCARVDSIVSSRIDNAPSPDDLALTKDTQKFGGARLSVQMRMTSTEKESSVRPFFGTIGYWKNYRRAWIKRILAGSK